MSVWSGRISTLALVAALFISGVAAAADSAKKPARDVPSFGLLQAPSAEVVRGQALAWLQGSGKTDEASTKAFHAIWAGDRPLLDKVADTLALGDAEAAKLLAEARDANAPAPTGVPAPIKDAKKP